MFDCVKRLCSISLADMEVDFSDDESEGEQGKLDLN